MQLARTESPHAAGGEAPASALDRLSEAQRRHATGAFATAERLYREALDLEPRLAEAVYALGRLAGQQRRLDDSCALAERAVALDPDNPAYRRAHGDALLALGLRAEAIEAYGAAIARKPDYDDVFLAKGAVLMDMGRHAQAAAAFESAVRVRPERAVAYARLSDALRILGAREDARAAAARAIAREPGVAQHRIRLGLCLEDLGEDDAAVAAYEQAVLLAPANPDAHLHHARALSALGRWEEAVQSLEEAAASGGADGTSTARVLRAEGEVLRRRGRLTEARHAFERAIAADAADTAAHIGLAHTYLATGEEGAGFAALEQRLDARPPLHASALWDGHAARGLRLLLVDEGHPSETVFMMRHVPALAAEGLEVSLAVESRYHALLGTCRGLARTVARGADVDCDVHLPIMSLGQRRGAGPALGETPILSADPARRAIWADRLRDTKGLKVGLHWRWDGDGAGHRRAVPISHLAPLLALEGVSFVNLNRGLRLAAATDFGPGLDADGAFLDTAAIMACLDIVLTVDGVMAHVAAALGRPTWIMLSDDADWRWGRERADCPRYPNVRLFRQRGHADWDHMIARVESALAERTYAS